jgi:hypothetical protein
MLSEIKNHGDTERALRTTELKKLCGMSTKKFLVTPSSPCFSGKKVFKSLQWKKKLFSLIAQG